MNCQGQRAGLAIRNRPSSRVTGKDFWGGRFFLLENYNRFIKRDNPLSSWSNFDEEEFIALDPIHGPAVMHLLFVSRSLLISSSCIDFLSNSYLISNQFIVLAIEMYWFELEVSFQFDLMKKWINFQRKGPNWLSQNSNWQNKYSATPLDLIFLNKWQKIEDSCGKPYCNLSMLYLEFWSSSVTFQFPINKFYGWQFQF